MYEKFALYTDIIKGATHQQRNQVLRQISLIYVEIKAEWINHQR